MRPAVTITCPMCKSQITVPDSYEFRPFCSARCKKLDLLNWLEGRYNLPRELLPEEFDQLPPEKREEAIAFALQDLTVKDGSV